jgi:hypothetical protein
MSKWLIISVFFLASLECLDKLTTCCEICGGILIGWLKLFLNTSEI